MPHAPPVSAVIANYDGAAVLGDCLASLQTQTLVPAEIVVVDAGSTDASAEVARAHSAAFVPVPNRGLGFLYNTGARVAAHELVLLANNDVALEPSCLERLVAALESDPRAFAADPRQLDWAGTTQIHARTLLRRGPLMRTPIAGLVVDPNADSSNTTPALAANAGIMLVRRRALLELGGFDETFFLDYEDLDLCWRAWARGLRSLYVPDAVVRHHVNATTGPASPRRLRGSHHNVLRFALKCLPAADAAKVVAVEIARAARHPAAVAPALARTARELPEILRLRRELRPHARLLEQLLALDD